MDNLESKIEAEFLGEDPSSVEARYSVPQYLKNSGVSNKIQAVLDKLKQKNLIPQKTTPAVFLAGVSFFILIIGTVSAAALVSVNQDLRQQAATGCSVTCANGESFAGDALTFPSCDAWANEACAPRGGIAGSDSSSDNNGNSGEVVDSSGTCPAGTARNRCGSCLWDKCVDTSRHCNDLIRESCTDAEGNPEKPCYEYTPSRCAGGCVPDPSLGGNGNLACNDTTLSSCNSDGTYVTVETDSVKCGGAGAGSSNVTEPCYEDGSCDEDSEEDAGVGGEAKTCPPGSTKINELSCDCVMRNGNGAKLRFGTNEPLPDHCEGSEGITCYATIAPASAADIANMRCFEKKITEGNCGSNNLYYSLSACNAALHKTSDNPTGAGSCASGTSPYIDYAKCAQACGGDCQNDSNGIARCCQKIDFTEPCRGEGICASPGTGLCPDRHTNHPWDGCRTGINIKCCPVKDADLKEEEKREDDKKADTEPEDLPEDVALNQHFMTEVADENPFTWQVTQYSEEDKFLYRFYCPEGLGTVNGVRGVCASNEEYLGTVDAGAKVNFANFMPKACGAYQFDVEPIKQSAIGAAGAVTFEFEPCSDEESAVAVVTEGDVIVFRDDQPGSVGISLSQEIMEDQFAGLVESKERTEAYLRETAEKLAEEEEAKDQMFANLAEKSIVDAGAQEDTVAQVEDKKPATLVDRIQNIVTAPARVVRNIFSRIFGGGEPPSGEEESDAAALPGEDEISGNSDGDGRTELVLVEQGWGETEVPDNVNETFNYILDPGQRAIAYYLPDADNWTFTDQQGAESEISIDSNGFATFDLANGPIFGHYDNGEIEADGILFSQINNEGKLTYVMQNTGYWRTSSENVLIAVEEVPSGGSLDNNWDWGKSDGDCKIIENTTENFYELELGDNNCYVAISPKN